SLILHNLEAFRAWWEQQQIQAALHSNSANNPIRKQEQSANAAHTTGVKIYKAETIKRRIVAGYRFRRNYLRIHNINEEGQLICKRLLKTGLKQIQNPLNRR